MKIHHDSSSPQTNATDALASTTDQTPTGRAQTASARPDQLTLSPEALVLKAMTDRAAEPVAIRQDVVDRMRALLESGGLGDDPARLADVIIADGLTLP